MKARHLILFIALITGLQAGGQILNIHTDNTFDSDSIKREYDRGPYFGLYKDNYIIFGPSIGPKPTVHNTNVKFQISISQKLTRSTLPWGTYLYLYYTQKVFWNILENSMPMTDLNFNPGIGIAKPIYSNHRYIGKATLQIEHESNGRDNAESRSWNKISLGANIIIDQNLIVHGKFWIPIVDGVNNKDILKYCGIYQVGTSIMSNNRRWSGNIVLVKRQSWNLFNFNTVLELAFRISRSQNQFLFLQYYNGYGEGLLDYKKFHSQLRLGFVIKPVLFSDF